MARLVLVDPVERVGQLEKVDVAVDAAKALPGHQHSRGGPSQAHRRIPPARDVPRGSRDHGIYGLHNVHRGKRPAQIIWQPQAGERQYLGHALPDQPHRSRADVVVFLRQVLEKPLRLRGIGPAPCLPQRDIHRRVVLLRKPLDYVAAILDRGQGLQ